MGSGLQAERQRRQTVPGGDQETGEEGLIVFQDDRIQWISDTEVEVGGGYYRGNQGSSSGEYRVVKEGSRWVVKKGEMLLIS